MKSLASVDFSLLNKIIEDLYNPERTLPARLVGFLNTLPRLVYYDRAAILFFYRKNDGTYVRHSSFNTNWEHTEVLSKVIMIIIINWMILSLFLISQRPSCLEQVISSIMSFVKKLNTEKTIWNQTIAFSLLKEIYLLRIRRALWGDSAFLGARQEMTLVREINC